MCVSTSIQCDIQSQRHLRGHELSKLSVCVSTSIQCDIQSQSKEGHTGKAKYKMQAIRNAAHTIEDT